MNRFSIRIFAWMFTAILMAVVGVGVGPPRMALAQECGPVGAGGKPSISADGRFVAFGSYASNLVSGDTNDEHDVFVHDRETGETTRVSVASDGAEGNGGSFSATGSFPVTLSADGRFVAFSSDASNLVPDDNNSRSDVFVHDRETSETTRVSVASDGTEGNGGSFSATLSADGRFVAFISSAWNLAPGGDFYTGVFVHDRETSETTRVSVASDGTEGKRSNRISAGNYVALSADGRFIVFGSSASNLVPGDTNYASDVFVQDRDTGETTRVSVASDGAEGNESSTDVALSADGRFVAFGSYASNLVPGDTNDEHDVFIHDRDTGETTRVSVASDGAEGNGQSADVALSADGRFVAFGSYASNLVPDDTNVAPDVFVHDRETRETTRVSVASDGVQGRRSSNLPSMSADGRFVAFGSYASNLDPNDNNGLVDVFVHDRETGITEAASVPNGCGGTQPTEYQLTGLVKDENDIPQGWVDVIVNPGNHLLKTDSQGVYTLMVPAGMYTVEVGVPDYTSYPSQQMVEVAQDTTLVPFTYYPCISPHTSLNVCELEVGDILLERSATLAQTVASVFGYWFHSGVFIGGNEVSQAVGLRENDDDEVINDPIFITNWWTGDVEDNFQDWFDWAVLRPNTDLSTKAQAASYMEAQADRANPPVVYVPYDQPWEINIYELLAAFRYSEDQVYCNQLAWLSYDKLGLDLEIDNPVLTVLPIESRVVLQNVIFGSDLYASTYHDLSSLQQQQESVVRVAKRMTLSFITAIVDELAPDAQGASLRDYNAPVRVVVTDSQGRRTGYNSETGEIFNEIPGAAYTAPGYTLETFSFKVLEGEVYTVTVTGIADGDYVVFTRMTGDIEETGDAAQASISAGETMVFTINPFAEDDDEIIVEEEEEQPDSSQVFLPLLAR